MPLRNRFEKLFRVVKAYLLDVLNYADTKCLVLEPMYVFVMPNLFQVGPCWLIEVLV
jgi:hypothetical protein